MYLDGQLPYGPPSSNVGAPPAPAITVAAPATTFVVPGGGDTIVSPTVADANGIVQYPLNEPRTSQFRAPRTDTASYSECGDYGAAGSLPTIRARAGRGMGVKSGLSGMCQSGEQGYQALAIAKPSGLGVALVALGALALLAPGARR